ncbi:MAG: hypothetical protein Q9200_007091 [Gallowayella weberi]
MDRTAEPRENTCLSSGVTEKLSGEMVENMSAPINRPAVKEQTQDDETPFSLIKHILNGTIWTK